MFDDNLSCLGRNLPPVKEDIIVTITQISGLEIIVDRIIQDYCNIDNLVRRFA